MEDLQSSLKSLQKRTFNDFNVASTEFEPEHLEGGKALLQQAGDCFLMERILHILAPPRVPKALHFIGSSFLHQQCNRTTAAAVLSARSMVILSTACMKSMKRPTGKSCNSVVAWPCRRDE